MRTPKLALLFLPLLLLSLLLSGAPLRAQGVLEPQSQNGVAFVSGGVGEESREALRAVERDYNLRLMFAAQGSGQYLSDVRVTIAGAKGILVDADAEGPLFFARLAPGSYKVTATTEGRSQTRGVEIAAGKRASVDFYWPNAK
jgi:hypothetical protein